LHQNEPFQVKKSQNFPGRGHSLFPTPLHSGEGTPPLHAICKRGLYTAEKYFELATIPSLTLRVYLHSCSRCCLQNRKITRNFDKIWPYSSSRSSKVIDLGVNRKLTCNFLLLINSNFNRICYRFRDIHAER